MPRKDREAHELRELVHELSLIVCELREVVRLLNRPTLSTRITFEEKSMNPTAAGQTQVFTGTLSPTGSVLASDAVATITSNDPAVQPTLDSTQLVVSVTYPAGWTESATMPLSFAYATTSASTGQALLATITPSAPVNANLATSVSFSQSQ